MRSRIIATQALAFSSVASTRPSKPGPSTQNEADTESTSVRPALSSALRPRRNFFSKAKPSTSRRKPAVATLGPVAIDSTARKGIGNTVARRRFQRGTVYLNKPKTQWIGAYLSMRWILMASSGGKGSALFCHPSERMMAQRCGRMRQRICFSPTSTV